ncbi:MAG: T9SS type A sorting domain-containing protein [Ignavibacteriales bacterium]|nr:T9SS type A sorting domain-containing protein [Ignavibacteriales bacterium]
MRKNIFTFIAVLFLSTTLFGQWTNEGVFPADSSLQANTGVHGAVVTPDGNVWIAPYRSYVADSVYNPDSGRKFLCRPVYVFQPDGTPLDTIRSIVVGGTTRVFLNSNVGLSLDHNGNVMLASYNEVFKINYQTYEGIAWVDLANHGLSGVSICAPGAVENGDVYVVSVFPAKPVVHLDSNLVYIDNALDSYDEDYGRDFAAKSSGDTTWLFFPRYTGLWIYEKIGDFGTFALVDSLKGPSPETIKFDPVDGNVWLSGGGFSNLPQAPYKPNVWYKFDLSTKTAIDSMHWNFEVGGTPANERPRAFAISDDGMEAWCGCFGSSTYRPVQKFSKIVGIQQDENILPTGYTLSQNYPNPFNPSTQITFAIPEAGMVTVKVYNMLGQEVATLVNEQLNAGQFTTTFSAATLASGTYIYELRVNDVRLANKMLLLK